MEWMLSHFYECFSVHFGDYMPKSPLPGQRSDGIAAKDLRVEERMRNRLRKPTTCYEHSSDVCCLLITMSSRCILFAYHLSTVRHEISRLCLHPVNCATLLSFTQPVAVTGRRHLRHRPVDCALMFYSFLFVERDGAGRRHLRHSHPVDASFLPVDANYLLLEILCG